MKHPVFEPKVGNQCTVARPKPKARPIQPPLPSADTTLDSVRPWFEEEIWGHLHWGTDLINCFIVANKEEWVIKPIKNTLWLFRNHLLPKYLVEPHLHRLMPLFTADVARHNQPLTEIKVTIRKQKPKICRGVGNQTLLTQISWPNFWH